jgi:hypothetical protein
MVHGDKSLRGDELHASDGERGERADGEGVDVGAGLGVGGVAALVHEAVVLVGPADDGAGELVGVGLVGRHPVPEAEAAVDVRAGGQHGGGCAAVVRLRGRVGAEAHDVGAVPRVGAQQVVHLLPRELVQPGRGQRLVPAQHRLPRPQQQVRVHHQQERRAGHVLRVGAVAEVDHAARGDEHLVERRVRQHRAHEVVRLRLEVLRAARRGHVELGQQHLRAGELEVPAELGHARRDGLVGDEVRVHLPPRRQVQPGRGPQQLVVVARVGAVEGALAVVAAQVALGEREQQLRLVQQLARVLLVVAEHHGRGGERGRRLGGDLRPGRLRVDLVQRARRLHVLRPHPALVVQVGIADLTMVRTCHDDRS